MKYRVQFWIFITQTERKNICLFFKKLVVYCFSLNYNWRQQKSYIILSTTYFQPGLAICPPFLVPPSHQLTLQSSTTTSTSSSSSLPPTNTNLHQHLNPNNPSLLSHSLIPASNFLLPTTNAASALSGQDQYHPHTAAATANIQLQHHQPHHNPALPALCYCGHCCPPPSLVGAVTPTLILSRYTEINLCDTISLRNYQQHQAQQQQQQQQHQFHNQHHQQLINSSGVNYATTHSLNYKEIMVRVLWVPPFITLRKTSATSESPAGEVTQG